MEARVRLILTGRVQGVGFRASCAREARRLSLVGSVRNLPDGTVEVIAEGERSAVDAITKWCRRGPMYASVRTVECVEQEPQGEHHFHILG